MQLIVDGIPTNYQDAGKGQSIVLLHGWGDDLRTFDLLSESLQQSHRVIRLDLPGFGKTEPPKETFDLQKYAEFVAAFLEKIGAGSIGVIIGHSNGGAIAIKAVSDGLLQPKKLVLLASSGVRSEHKSRKKVLRLTAKALKLPTGLLPKKAQQKLKKQAYRAIGSDIFVAENLQDTFRAVVGEDLREQSESIDVKTLLLYGAEDVATPPRFGELYHDCIKGSQLHIIDGAGHFLHHEKPAEVEKYIKEFLDEE